MEGMDLSTVINPNYYSVEEDFSMQSKVQYEDELVEAQLEPLIFLYNELQQAIAYTGNEMLAREYGAMLLYFRSRFPHFDAWVEANHGS